MHWSDRLPAFFNYGENNTVTITIDAEHDNHSMVTVAAAIGALYDALKTRQTDDHDPLADEDPGDLLTALDYTHRVIRCLTAQEDRLIGALRDNDISARRIGTHMQVDHKTVLYRLDRIDRLADPVVASTIPSQPGGTMSNIQKMEMPAVCARCDEWFELNDMYGSDVESDSGSRLECLSCHQKACAKERDMNTLGLAEHEDGEQQR